MVLLANEIVSRRGWPYHHRDFSPLRSMLSSELLWTSFRKHCASPRLIKYNGECTSFQRWSSRHELILRHQITVLGLGPELYVVLTKQDGGKPAELNLPSLRLTFPKYLNSSQQTYTASIIAWLQTASYENTAYWHWPELSCKFPAIKSFPLWTEALLRAGIKPHAKGTIS